MRARRGGDLTPPLAASPNEYGNRHDSAARKDGTRCVSRFLLKLLALQDTADPVDLME